MLISLRQVLAFIGVVAVGLFGLAVLEENGAAEESHPPHAERREAVSPNQGDSLFLPEVQGWVDTAVLVAAVEAWATEEARLADEAAAAEEAARMLERQRMMNPAPAPAPENSLPGECAGVAWAIPEYIVYRESRCNFHSVNQTGCGGFTCVGAYQFDLRHWIPQDQGGWGGCAHFGDWTVPENQHACANQMSRGGTNLAPWGG